MRVFFCERQELSMRNETGENVIVRAKHGVVEKPRRRLRFFSFTENKKLELLLVY